MAVKFEFLEISSSNIKFALHSNVSFANALRRILLSEISCLAIEYVEISENTSVFADESISHRLGLLPLEDNISLLDKNSCNCENYCCKCAIIFNLDKTNNTSENINIYGTDLTIENKDLSLSLNQVLICKLAPKQKIVLKGIARRNPSGLISHVKYCPVTAVSFTYDEGNLKKHTNLWRENDETVTESWPFVEDRADIYDTSSVERVVMNVEVVEGVGKPKDILLKALSVYKKKFEAFLDF